MTPRPADGRRRPAVLWLVGGFDNGIGESAWLHAAEDNDQSARAFREAGLVSMLPSLRGGNDNPGFRETFYGEVDDVIAAARYLARLDYVDPARIYLGGHSTGGTLALLVAASTARFRAVFAFGPAANPTGYGRDVLAFDPNDEKEVELRSPLTALDGVVTPTFIIEGTQSPSNAGALPVLELAAGDAPVHVIDVPGADHFSILAPVTRLLAAKIRDSRSGAITVARAELEAAVSRSVR